MRTLCTLLCTPVYAETIAITTLYTTVPLVPLNLGKLEKNNKEQAM